MARLLGRPLAVEMGPQFATTPDTILAARLNVDVDVGDILEWRAAPISLPIDGIAPLDISVTVTDDIAVQIESDLRGVQVDLPLPWGKKRESAAPLALTWSDRGWADWEVFWFGRFFGCCRHVGKWVSNIRDRCDPKNTTGLSISGG